MIVEKFELKRNLDTISSFDDVIEVFKQMEDYIVKLEKVLNDELKHLDSDNITEVDFGRTRYKHHTNTLLKDYAMKAWVTANFQPKS